MIKIADFNIEAYLHRIGLPDVPHHNLEGLHRLLQAQFFSIPFENLDIRLGRSIDLRPDILFQKLVMHKRGGYCFELNGLLLLALQALAFSARPLLARVHLQPTPQGRVHQLILVEMDARNWIVDAGFGASGPPIPMRLEENYISQVKGDTHRLVESPLWGWMLQTRENGVWKDSYSFDLSLATPQDIQLGNFYTSHSADSPFTQANIASIATKDGRVSLHNEVLTQLSKESVLTTKIPPGPGYFDILNLRSV